jgi:hypothetical protein
MSTLHDLYFFVSIIRNRKSRMMKWMGDAAHTRQKRSAYNILYGKPEGIRPL